MISRIILPDRPLVRHRNTKINPSPPPPARRAIYFFTFLFPHLICKKPYNLGFTLFYFPRFVKTCYLFIFFYSSILISSGGQQRRVSFAVSLLHNPELLILDEPTVGVDPMLRQKWANFPKK